MAKIPTLTVTTEFGTFTRQTARTYTHLVIVSGERCERLEGTRLANLAEAKKNLAKYQRTIETGQCQDARNGQAGEYDRQFTAQSLADGSFQKWVAWEQDRIQHLEAQGPITEDQGTGTWTVISWNGRLDLARKEAQGTVAARYRKVHVIEVATGKVVL